MRYSAPATHSSARSPNSPSSRASPESVGNTPIKGLPDYLFVAFQSTFAGITTALIVGAFAERIKFRAVLLFSALWFTLSYIPMAHIVWGRLPG